jgi:hypothetical protein
LTGERLAGRRRRHSQVNEHTVEPGRVRFHWDSSGDVDTFVELCGQHVRMTASQPHAGTTRYAAHSALGLIVPTVRSLMGVSPRTAQTCSSFGAAIQASRFGSGT